MTDPLSGALAMAARGLKVYRLRDGTKIPLAGSKPLEEATTDATTIRQWFGNGHAYNVGVLTDGHVVVDVDNKGGRNGHASLLDLPDMPRSLTVKTPTGGWHIYYRTDGPEYSNGGKDAIAPGIDVRCHHGLAVGPGSTRRGSPERYEILIDAPIAIAPECITSRLRRWQDRAEASDVAVVEQDTPLAIKLAREWLIGEAPPATLGARDETAYRVACELRDRALSEPTALEVMAELWLPRCSPPLELDDLARVVGNAFRYAKSPPGVAAIEHEFEALPPLPEAPPAPPAPPIFAPLDLSGDPSAIPPRPWIVRGHLMRGAITTLVAPGGVGKSALTLAWAMALAMGSGDWIGLPVTAPHRVLIVNNEDDTDELKRRGAAARIAHGLDAGAMGDRLHSYAVPGTTFCAAKLDEAGRRLIPHEHLSALVKYIDAHAIDVVVLDPFVEIHEGDENDNRHVSEVMKLLRKIVQTRRVSMVLVHHTRKMPGASSDGYAGNADASRGASALNGAARVVFTLFGMTEKEAEEHGVLASARRRYMRLDGAKGNYHALGGPQWFEHRAIDIGRDVASAVRPADLTAGDARAKAAVAALLLPHILEAGGALGLANAAKIVHADDVLSGGASVQTWRRRLADMFEAPAEVGGVRVACTPPDINGVWTITATPC